MSSLAGALDDYPQSRPGQMRSTHGQFSDDIEMTTPLSPKNDPEEEEENDDDEDEDEDDEAKVDAEMSDLFGNDNDVVEQRHARFV